MSSTDDSGLSDEVKRVATEAHQAFSSIVNPILREKFISDGFPDRLCHYTDFAGLKGILEGGSLWATHSQTLNDPSEQRYGEEVVRGYLAALSDGKMPDRISTAIGSSKQRNFACCFCEGSQVLSMWTTYAARGGGFCLEFDGARGLLPSSFPPFNVRLPFKMTYGSVLPRHTQSILKHAWEFARRGEAEATVCAVWARLLALSFKHPAFRHEDEWRIVIPNPPASAMRFRAGHSDIKPYVELRPSMPDGKRLPLRKVIFGPTLRQDEVLVDAIGLMLERYGYEGVAVEKSEIPYRL